MSVEHPDYVTTSSGMRGYYAVYMKWCEDHGGFYEPWNTGETCKSFAECKRYAEEWAKAEGVEFK